MVFFLVDLFLTLETYLCLGMRLHVNYDAFRSQSSTLTASPTHPPVGATTLPQHFGVFLSGKGRET